MKQRHNVREGFEALELTRRYLASAKELGQSDPSLHRQLSHALNNLLENPSVPSLNRHSIHDARFPGIMSSYVNLDVRMLDLEVTKRRARILNTGHHDPIYAWLRRYSGCDMDEIESVLVPANQAHPSARRALDPPIENLLEESAFRYLPQAAEGNETFGCIPTCDLMALGLTETQAQHIRRAPTNIDLRGFGISCELDMQIWELVYEYAPAIPDKPDLPVTTASAPMAVPLGLDDDVVTMTAQGQFDVMVEMGLDRYLALLTDEQRELAEIEQTGLLVVKGSAGSGKTAIATHRVRFLADRLMRQPALIPEGNPKALYLCYNRTLAQTVKQMLATLYGHEPPSCIQVSTIGQWANDYLVRQSILPASAASAANCLYAGVRRDILGRVRRCLRNQATAYQLQGLTPQFLVRELTEVIIGRGLESREDYLITDRSGQGKRLTEKMRHLIWDLYAEWRTSLKRERVTDINLVPWIALRHVAEDHAFQSYAAVIVDEAQDFTPVRLRLAAQLAGNALDRLTVFADAAQVIYASGFRWKLAELNPRGRQIRTINRNFRNTQEIHDLATGFLGADQGTPDSDTYVAAQPPQAHGPLPQLLVCRDDQAQVRAVCQRIGELIDQGTPPQQIAVLAGTKKSVIDYVQALRTCGIAARSPDSTARISITERSIKVLTMHSAKGLDFPTVFLVDLTQMGVPGPRSSQGVEDDAVLAADLQRRLLYMAMSRAGQRLILTTIAGSEHPLLADLPPSLYQRVVV